MITAFSLSTTAATARQQATQQQPTTADTPAPQPTHIDGPALTGYTLKRRGQQLPVPGELLAVTTEGARIRERSLVSIVSWDVIRRVTPPSTQTANNNNLAIHLTEPDPPTTNALASFAKTGEQVWRAATRLERGDWRAAEPLFQSLFTDTFPTTIPQQQQQLPTSTSHGQGGPTSQIIAEGLMRCRLQRGAHVQAIEPWFRYAKLAEQRAASNEPWVGGRLELQPVLDAVTKLSPAIPPIWPPDRIVERVSQEPYWQQIESAQSASAAIARLYRASLEVERGIPIDPALSASSRYRGDPGLELVRDILLSRGGRGADERESARRRLFERARSEASPRWMEAWCRAAVGRSLIREASESQRRQGMIELMHLPARFAIAQPALTEIALTEVASTLESLGEPAAAATVRAVLAERFGPESITRIWNVEPFDTPAQTNPATDQ